MCESSQVPVCNWLFERIQNLLVYSEWSVVLIDFNKKRARDFVGEIDEDNEIIYLDVKGGANPRVLVHEVLHIIFGDFLRDEARNIPSSIRKKIRGKSILHKFHRWEELRVSELERCLFCSLSHEQLERLQDFIDKAKTAK